MLISYLNQLMHQQQQPRQAEMTWSQTSFRCSTHLCKNLSLWSSCRDPTLTTLHTYIHLGWPAWVPKELKHFAKVQNELSCWDASYRWHTRGTWVVVKLKQRCQDLSGGQALIATLKDRSETVNRVYSVERLDNRSHLLCSLFHGHLIHGSSFNWTFVGKIVAMVFPISAFW